MSPSYGSDLTDAQWELLSGVIPAAKPGGRPRSVNMRAVVNAIFYILCAGCTWHLLPHDVPKWKTVYHYFDNGASKEIGNAFMNSYAP